jgi:hypothetical protein
MTERDAIAVFDGLRKAQRSLKPGDDLRALHTLLTAHILPSALGESVSSAFGTFRTVFNEIDNWESRNSSS